MLTKLTIHTFKRFDDVSIDLSHGMVFIGPNNSGAIHVMAISAKPCGHKA